MSLAPRNPAEREQLANISKAFFQSQGWEIDHLTKGNGHFIVKKDRITVFVSCHDSEGRKFFSSFQTMAALTKKARDMKLDRGIPTVFVFASHLPDVEPDLAAATGGLVLLTPEELHLVTGLERFSRDLPGALAAREAAILREQVSLCLSIVDRFEQSGNLPAAIEWARHAVQAADRYTKAHDRLFGLLVEAGDLAAAKALAQTVLRKDPDNMVFLRAMRTLSARAEPGSDAEGSVEDWDERIARAQQKAASPAARPESFEAILKRQAAATTPQPAQPATVAPVAASGRGIAGLARLLFSRRS